MSIAEEIRYLDATSQAELVRTKEIKPIELVEAAIERIELLNPSLNAVVTPMYDIAREAATRDIPDGPFTGVPFLLKDFIAEYGGVRFTEGSAFLKDFVPDKDSELVVRYKKAGLIILGKTNTCEFGFLPATEPHFFGPTRNPWDTNRSPAGSSGGSAVAVSVGMVPMAHGNDGGGSIRMPTSCCGIFGLKPTRGRNPLGPFFGDALSGLVAEHALTRTVRDSAALLDATSGPDLGDPYIAPQVVRPYKDEVGSDPGCLRIAFTTKSPTGTAVHNDCVQAVQEAVKLCTDLGHELEEIDLTLEPERFLEPLVIIWYGAASWILKHWERRTGKKPSPDQFEPLTWALKELGDKYSAGDYLLALEDLQRFAREVVTSLDDYDVWLTPTLAEPPVPLGTFDSTIEEPFKGWYRTDDFMPFTAICNVTGQPAMSVPLYWNSEGLPIGTHFVGRYGDEASLFRLAAQLEENRPWANRHPPVYA